MSCDLCGANEQTILVKIEGIAYDACENCARYGTRILEAAPTTRPQRGPDERVVRADVGAVLRAAREASGQKMEDFAKMLSVKTSDLHAWETGHRRPTVEMAEQLGKRLRTNLLDAPRSVDYSATLPKSSSGGGMTIADLLKKK